MFKRFLKSRIPETWWKTLRNMRKWARRRRKGIWRQSWLNLLGTSIKIWFLERTRVYGRLDYDKANIRMLVRTSGQLTRLNACDKEPETVAWIERVMRPGLVFYDIGANVGAYALIAWAVAKGQGRVYAFEPKADRFFALTQNIRLNEAEHGVVAVPVALGDKSATTPLLIQPLDDLITRFGLEPPTHIKIDVDGHETEVMAGATKTLQSLSLKSILIEINSALDADNALVQALLDYGFVLEAKFARGKGGSQTIANHIFVRP